MRCVRRRRVWMAAAPRWLHGRVGCLPRSSGVDGAGRWRCRSTERGITRCSSIYGRGARSSRRPLRPLRPVALQETTVLRAMWDWGGPGSTTIRLPRFARFVRSDPPALRREEGPARASGRIGPTEGRRCRASIVDRPRPTPPLRTARALRWRAYGCSRALAALGEGSEAASQGVSGQAHRRNADDAARVLVAGLGAAQSRCGCRDRWFAARLGPPASSSRDDRPTRSARHVVAESGGRPARAAGAFVVLDQGHLVAYLERGGRSILTFTETAANQRWAEALTTLVKDGRLRSLEITRIDAVPARESAHHPALLAAGFVGGYRGLIYRAH